MGLGPQNLWPDFQIPKVVAIRQADFSIDLDLLPREHINGELKIASSPSSRCKIKEGGVIAESRLAYIRHILRSPEAETPLCVKIPKNKQYSICPEALVQWICSRALISADIHGAIPHVYDIYRYFDQTRFTMEFIKGDSAIETIFRSPTPDTTWLQILAQTALILGYLEEHVRLDHRDLKADNLWIRPQPISYTLKVGGVTWHIEAPFQVVLLDFGYACIGNEDGVAAVTLIDRELPLLDPCPKEGRDLFQLLGSMLYIPEVKARFSAEMLLEMEMLLKHRGANYMELVHSIYLIYGTAADKRFRLPALHPVSVLERLAHEWYPTAGVSIVTSKAPSPAPIEFLASRPGSAAAAPSSST